MAGSFARCPSSCGSRIDHRLPSISKVLSPLAAQRFPMTYPRDLYYYLYLYSMCIYIFIFAYMNGWFFMVKAGRYTSPMDPIGLDKPFVPKSLIEKCLGKIVAGSFL